MDPMFVHSPERCVFFPFLKEIQGTGIFELKSTYWEFEMCGYFIKNIKINSSWSKYLLQ